MDVAIDVLRYEADYFMGKQEWCIVRKICTYSGKYDLCLSKIELKVTLGCLRLQV